MKKLLLIPIVFALSACSNGVPWDNYANGLKNQIDRLADDKDCSGLQKQFDIAYDNHEAQKNRVGQGNAKLLEYLDEKMKGIGCY